MAQTKNLQHPLEMSQLPFSEEELTTPRPLYNISIGGMSSYAPMPEESEILKDLKPKDLSTWWKLAPILAQLGDATSVTMMRKESAPDRALRDAVKDIGGGDIGAAGYEKNSLMKDLVDHPELNIPFKLGLGLLSSYVANMLAKKNKTAGKVMSGASLVSPTIGTYTNLKQYKKAKANKHEKPNE
jgi:hypothetical protein